MTLFLRKPCHSKKCFSICLRSMTSKTGNRDTQPEVSDRKNRVFSGIQPTGIPHLGNYLGVIKLWVDFQERYDDVFFSIVDLHAITVKQDPKILRENILGMTASLLACGIDPEKCVLFQQSQVKQHLELSWILSCISTYLRVQRLPNWKEKNKDNPSIGLFTYPILQAADILLYKSTLVPVGEDQRQHLELCEELTISFNNKFGLMFIQPRPLYSNTARIKSLRHPDAKMSKSETNPIGRIDLTDTDDEILKKIKKAVTDFTSQVTYDKEKRPGVSNLIDIHSACTGKTPQQICEAHSSISTGEYKLLVADAVINEIRPIREKMTWLLSDKSHLQSVLKVGQEVASVIAEDTMSEVRKLVGFR